MGARAVRQVRVSAEERAKLWWLVAMRLQAGEELDLRDERGASVRMRRIDKEWVLHWGSEPAWKGSEHFIARLAVQVIDADSLQSLVARTLED